MVFGLGGDGLEKKVTGINAQLKQAIDYMTKLDTLSKKVADNTSKIKIQSGTGSFAGTSGTAGTGTSGNETMTSSTQINTPPMNPGGGGGNILSNALSIFGGVMKAGAAVGGAVINGMPNVGQTIGYATNYYNAAALSGNGNYHGMMRASFGAMNGGLTSAYSDAAMASYMAQHSVNPMGALGQATFAGAGNAAKMIGMDNMAYTQATVGMYTGKASSQLMSSAGVWTTDPNTGKKLSQSKIFEQIFNRARQGGTGKLSAEEVQNSMLGGGLGAWADAAGFDENQKQLFQVYSMARAKGQNLDMSNSASVAAAAKSMGITLNDNPQNGIMGINANQTATSQAFIEPYIKGINDAKDAIVLMNEQLVKTPDYLKSLNATLATLAGNPAGASATNLAGQALGFAGPLLGQALGNLGSGGKGGAGTGGVGKGGAGSTIGKGGVKLGTAGKVGGIAGLALTALDLGMDVANGNGWGTQKFSHDAGAGIGGTIGAIAGSFIPVPVLGTMLGGAVGSWIGGMIGDSVGGSPGTGGTNTSAVGAGNTTPAGGTSTGFIWPTKGPVVDEFGYRKPVQTSNGNMSSSNHQGIDIQAPMGQNVVASAAGKVVHAGWFGGYGKTVKIDHGNGYVTQYSHLSVISVSMGSTVTQGKSIGQVGSTGNSTGAHLHFGVLHNGSYINPRSILGGSTVVSTSGTGAATTASGSASKSSGWVTAGTSGNDFDSILGVGAGPSSASSVASLKGPSALGGNAMGVASPSVSGGSSVGGSSGIGTASGPGNRSQNSTYLSGAPRAKNGKSYVANDGPVNVHSGEAILTSEQASVWREAIKESYAGKGKGANVTINLTIGQASDAEAKRFAKIVKDELESDRTINSMGRR